MRDADFNAFVIACTPIARSEVSRLSRRGVRIDFEDGVQHALLSIIESRHLFKPQDAPIARLHMRSRLIDAFIERPMAKKRMGVNVSLDEARDAGVDAHEDETIARIDAQKILARWPFPKETGATRQAADQRRWRWRDRVLKALNDNTERVGAKEAA